VGGGLYLVGVTKPDVDISVNIFGAIGGQKRMLGVNFGSTNAKRDIPMYAQLYLQGRMNLDDLVSKQISLREVNDGYSMPQTRLSQPGRRHFVLNSKERNKNDHTHEDRHY
jgi:S-(hydroxymethyl)glutathione dehydrogenase/alcohol dehydrogenase